MDSCGGTTTADKTVRVVNIAHDPTAIATVVGSGTANEGGDNVQLDGSMSSDPDLDPLTYVWTQCGGPAVTLVYSPGDTDHIMPMFVTPWVSANTPLKFKLTVSDPCGWHFKCLRYRDGYQLAHTAGCESCDRQCGCALAA